MRILSLIASSTEIVYSLGMGSKIIGRSHECDFPNIVKNLPFCTEPRFDINGTSLEIDNRVKSLLQEALSIYLIDEKKLNDLQPDIIITQSQCDVCAVSLADVEKAVKKIIGKTPRIISLEPNSLEDVWSDIHKIGEALDINSISNKLVFTLKSRINDLKELISKLEHRSIVCIEWIEPLMAAGNWVPQLVELAGGINLLGEKGKHSPWMDIDELFEKNPEKIIIMPCGYDIQKANQEMTKLSKTERWKSLKAVKSKQVYLTDGNQYFNRPGPRLVESLEILIEIIHDHKFNFNHEGSGWVKYF
jgi:iron complex transport system substrate-binding protein